MEFSDLNITPIRAGRYATICPQCNETRKKHKGAKCLTVNNEPNNRWFKCNHCGWSGNLDAMDKFKAVYKESRMPETPREFSLEIRNYLEKRGISLRTAKKAKLYDASTKGKKILGFPYFIGITLVNVKFLNIKWKGEGPKWWQLKKDLGTRIVPFGMQTIKLTDDKGVRPDQISVIITEGEWDKLTWDECGYENVVSVPQGAPSINSKNFKEEFRYLQDKYVKSIFDQVDIFYLSVDNDEPGRKLRDLLGMILGKEKCRIIQYPVGYKDINEVYKGDEKKGLEPLGKKGVDECFNNVKAFPIKGIVRPSDVRDELRKIRENGFLPGLKCGIEDVDRLFTVKKKHMTFVTGVPGAGKSVWIRWWLTELIKNNEGEDVKFALFTPENRPVAREHAKIAECITGKSIRAGRNDSMSEEQYRKVMNYIERHFFVISPDRTNYEDFKGKIESDKVNTITSIQSYLEYLKKTENIFGYVIDAWNKIEHEQPKWQSETTFISKQLDRLLNFNAYWDLHGIIIVHPTKIQLGSDRNYKMPTLYDIKGSSAWKEKADIGIIIHRNKLKKKPDHEITEEMDDDEKYLTLRDAPTIIRTEKIRFEEVGVEDRIRMKMNGYGQFYFPKKAKEKKEDGFEKISLVIDDEEEMPF